MLKDAMSLQKGEIMSGVLRVPYSWEIGARPGGLNALASRDGQDGDQEACGYTGKATGLSAGGQVKPVPTAESCPVAKTWDRDSSQQTIQPHQPEGFSLEAGKIRFIPKATRIHSMGELRSENMS